MTARFIHIPHCGSNKRIDIKPYIIDEQMCTTCGGERCHHRYATYFCAEPSCLQYFCERCWDLLHYKGPFRANETHLPYVRSGDSTRQLHYVPHLAELAMPRFHFPSACQVNYPRPPMIPQLPSYLPHQIQRLWT